MEQTKWSLSLITHTAYYPLRVSCGAERSESRLITPSLPQHLNGGRFLQQCLKDEWLTICCATH